MSVEQADRWDPVLRQCGRFIRSSSFSQMFEDLLDHLPVFDAALRSIGDNLKGPLHSSRVSIRPRSGLPFYQ